MAEPGRADVAVFLGRLTAGATHELRNVLAIVKESAGLVEDLLAVGEAGGSSADRVTLALGRIEAQVGRGAALLTSLNRVAHGLDRSREEVVLGEAIGHAALLCQRFARERSRGLEAQVCGEDVTVTASAMAVYMALVAGMEWGLEAVPEGAVVEVGLDDAGHVRFGAVGGVPAESSSSGAGSGSGPAQPAFSWSLWGRLEEALAELPATAVRGESGGFTLLFG